MASIRKRTWTGAGGKEKEAFIVDFKNFDGKRSHKTFAKRGDAKDFAVKIEADLARGKRLTRSLSVTVADVAAEFIRKQEDRLKVGEISRSYFVTLRTALDTAVLPFFGKGLLSDVTPAKIDDWKTWMIVTKGLAPISARYRIRQMRRMEAFAVGEGYTEAEPVKRVLMNSRPVQRDPIRVFETQDVESLLGAVQVRREGMRYRTGALLQAVVSLGALCGLRYGEIMGLRLCDLNLDTGELTVAANMSAWKVRGPTKTAAGTRTAYMTERVRGAILAYVKDFHSGKPTDLLFTTNSGQTITNGAFHVHYWQPLLDAAGLGGKDEKGRRLTFHALRHYFVSWAINIGLPGPDIAKMVGHTSYGLSLKVYAHALTNRNQQTSAMEEATRRMFPIAAPACNMGASST